MAPPGRQSLLARSWAALPRGGALPQHAWSARHRGILALLWVHVVALALIGLATGASLMVSLLASGAVAVLTMLATWGPSHQTLRASFATTGLLVSSAVLIEQFDGLIEAHFHFFVTVVVVSLYQSWSPYFLAVGFVLTHHLVLGTLFPNSVYNHSMAHHDPWLFALVHGGAVLAESAACLVFWRVTEDALDAERDNGEVLKQTNAELTRANAAVADLVAMLSHDLRTPLMVVLGYSEMTLESWDDLSDADRVDFVRRINRAGHEVGGLLEDTLAASALDADGITPAPAPTRVDELVRSTLATLPGPPLDVDLDGLDECTALVDPRHLHQVLTNLATNAAKYGAGRLAVSARSEEDQEVVLRFSDFGPGVSATFVPRMFDRFSRADEARSGNKQGTGLGLFITRSLLVLNGGDITYEPTPGGGATFVVRLPATTQESLQPV